MRTSQIQMADISNKAATKREAMACAKVIMKKETLRKLREGAIPKGDVLSCAKIAAILAAKKTHELIPLCHPLIIDNVDLTFDVNQGDGFVRVESRVNCYGKTGVEMEALTAVSIAALTIYDMCKPVDRGIIISDIKLLKKTGGKTGNYVRKCR
jgi:cyclic pyranopterin phosphate synthase